MTVAASGHARGGPLEASEQGQLRRREPNWLMQPEGFDPRSKGLRERNSPFCTLSQNGYGGGSAKPCGGRRVGAHLLLCVLLLLWPLGRSCAHPRSAARTRAHTALAIGHGPYIGYKWATHRPCMVYIYIYVCTYIYIYVYIYI